jgi:hypothetical protein
VAPSRGWRSRESEGRFGMTWFGILIAILVILLIVYIIRRL